MRIVVDLQGAQTESRFRGIGRYSLSFAKALARNRGEHEVIVALNGLFPETIQPIRDAFYGLLPSENIRVWNAAGPTREGDDNNQHRRDVAELVREAFLASLEPDVIHISSLFEGWSCDAIASIGRLDTVTPVTVTLYDLIPLLNPDQYLPKNSPYTRWYKRKINNLERAAACLAISEFSRQEGLSNLAFHEENIVNVSTAIEEDFSEQNLTSQDADNLQKKFKLSRPFLLYAGGADERKNLPRLIQAFAALPRNLRSEYQLLFAGKMPPLDVEHLLHCARNEGLGKDELIFTGYVSDQELRQLYSLCHLFVFPSWHEGFGLPALEAMSCGAAIIASNTTSLPEVIGREDALFDPLDVRSITKKITQVLESAAFREELRVWGVNQAKHFSWEESAKRAIHTFEQLHMSSVQVPLPRIDSQQAFNRLFELLGSTRHLGDLAEADLAKLSESIAQNHPSSSRLNMFVDISELVQRDAKTGIQRVVRSILKELLSSPPQGYEVYPVYSVSGEKCYRYASAFIDNKNELSVSAEKGAVIEVKNGDIFLGLDLQPEIVQDCRNYYQYLRKLGVQVYFIVYDLLPVSLPHAFPKNASQTHANWLDVVIENDGAICISQAVAEELSIWMQSRRESNRIPFKIHWFHLGADIESSVPSRGLPENADSILGEIQARPSFLMVGTVEPRKGHKQALASVEMLWEAGQDVCLVIVGKKGWEVDGLELTLSNHPELGKRLFWMDTASDEYLERIYSASSCLLMASEGEGFGLPLIEAARFEIPIIARDIPVFREVAEEHAYYFSGNKPEDLATSMRDWLDLREKGGVPESKGVTQLSWKESAAQLLKAFLPINQSVESLPDEANEVWNDAHSKPHVLQFTSYPIRKPRHGGQLRASAIRQTFVENGFDVQTIAFYQSEAYQSNELMPQDVSFPQHSKFRLYKGKNIPELSDFMMAAFSVEDPSAYEKVVQSIQAPIDVIIVEQSWFYRLAKRLKAEIPFCRDAIIVNSTHNVESRMKQDILGNESQLIAGAISDIEALEREAAYESDISVAVTEKDALVFREYGSKAVIVAPNGISPWIAEVDRLEAWEAKLPEGPWPIFIASAHPPNFTGFIDAVGNALGCIPPDSRLVIAGGVGPHLERVLLESPWGKLNSTRIQILGVLSDEDLIAVKQLAHAFLLPIGGGGGSNIKTAEALYSGKPVICTNTALRGFEDYLHFPTISIADSPHEFQKAVRVALQNKKPTSISEIDRRLRQRLTWAVSVSELPLMALDLLSKKKIK